MVYAAQLPAETSETTTGEFQEYRTRLALNVEGEKQGEEEKKPETTDRSEFRRKVWKKRMPERDGKDQTSAFALVFSPLLITPRCLNSNPFVWRGVITAASRRISEVVYLCFSLFASFVHLPVSTSFSYYDESGPPLCSCFSFERHDSRQPRHRYSTTLSL